MRTHRFAMIDQRWTDLGKYFLSLNDSIVDVTCDSKQGPRGIIANGERYSDVLSKILSFQFFGIESKNIRLFIYLQKMHN